MTVVSLVVNCFVARVYGCLSVGVVTINDRTVKFLSLLKLLNGNYLNGVVTLMTNFLHILIDV